jgi:hypothetical protein
MSYNGNGVFVINTAGQPVITGTTISSTTFNNLTADLATGLTTALTKDGQSTPTANIGMGAYKIVNLGAGTVASDAARLDQVQGGSATFITAAGTDTITGTTSPALTAYATGNQFSFVVANTNTGAVTINVDGLGAKAITRTGTTALVAADMVAGQTVEIIYDGTRFQLVNGNSFTNLKVSGTLGVTGVATFTAQPIVSSLTASLPIFTDGSKGLVSNAMTGTGSVVMSASPIFTGTVGAADLTTTGNTILGDATTDTLNVGAGGLVKDASGNVGIGTASPTVKLQISRENSCEARVTTVSGADMALFSDGSAGWCYTNNNYSLVLGTNNVERMRIDTSGNVGIGVTSPACILDISGATGGQIKFPATQNASANANTLDDYEEGTWTPTIIGTATAGVGTYTTQVGVYTKVGRLITISGTVIWTAHTGTGNMAIQAIPFPSLNLPSGIEYMAVPEFTNMTMPALTTPMVLLTNAGTAIYVYSQAVGSGTLNALTMDSAAAIYFSLTYQTN